MKIPKPVKLTLKQIKINARRYYKAGALQFQRKSKCEKGQCLYSAPCVIGASMPKAMRNYLDSNFYKQNCVNTCTDIQSVVNSNLVIVHKNEQRTISKIQELHDNLVQNTRLDRTEFLKAIGYK